MEGRIKVILDLGNTSFFFYLCLCLMHITIMKFLMLVYNLNFTKFRSVEMTVNNHFEQADAVNDIGYLTGSVEPGKIMSSVVILCNNLLNGRL